MSVMNEILSRLQDKDDISTEVDAIRVDPSVVRRVYGGQAGRCMCGCAGKYTEPTDGVLPDNKFKKVAKAACTRMWNKTTTVPKVTTRDSEGWDAVFGAGSVERDIDGVVTIDVWRDSERGSGRGWRNYRIEQVGRRNAIYFDPSAKVEIINENGRRVLSISKA